ncbi:MAG TPA: aspartate 1-decarboxylase [Fimbriimonadaceae bacterium]|nr:aspartate 1-decarboxylase [Fimbriimonadaceae bacterium]HRJ32182.1 aspartate 1-decarboxylase [Fimbriimonadaceae bacterium]
MRLLQLVKAKIHLARITYCNPEYVGSIEIDGDLMDRVGILDGELVHIWAVDHTSRLVTYAFRGPRGAIGMNGGAAHSFSPGDRVVIAAFALSDEPIEPKMILLDEENRFVQELKPYCVTG